jgi:prepilin-type N-terminal cleavage/methylation domain-containing protein
MAQKKIEDGFTLIELVVVIAILGIIGLIAIPKYIEVTATAKDNALKAQLGNIRAALAVDYANTGLTTGSASYASDLTGALFADGQIPKEPYTESAEVTLEASTGNITTFADDGGWIYNPTTGEVRADIAGKHAY